MCNDVLCCCCCCLLAAGGGTRARGSHHFPPKHQHVVLVTGAAGFIGFHVSLALVAKWGATVVGIDMFTEYYDVQLKRDRASELIKAGVSMYRGDVCDQMFISFLFDKFNFTSVIHLAAQAGVRHSMSNPITYLHNNIKCFTALLEVIRTHQVTCVCCGVCLS